MPKIEAYETEGGPSASPEQQKPPLKPRPVKPLHKLTALTDGQRFALRQKLKVHAGSSVRLVYVGNDPQLGIAFEQLQDIFTYAEWKTEPFQVNSVAVAGVNFPNGPYLTSANISAPTIKDVFSIFSGLGIDLPLVPDAYTGPLIPGAPATSPNVIIVLH